MSVFEHNHRARIYNPSQHPYKHTLDDFAFTHDALPGVSTLSEALNYVFAVLYPRAQDAVDEVADLPLVGNTIGDFRVVNDDGDGQAAGYQWQQREGDVAAKWYKIYDMDWGTDNILTGFVQKTLDFYVYRWGYNDLDSDGVAITGTFAGQRIYGGASANGSLTLSANSGDGTGANTGFVQVTDHFRPTANNTLDAGTTALKFRTGYFGTSVLAGTLTLASGSITDSSGTVDFSNENLTTTGTITGGGFSAASGVFGTLTVAAGSITDSSGAITFDNENLTTTGSVTAGSFVRGTLTIAAAQITDSSGTISFDNENLTTTGTITGGQVNGDNLRLDGNTLSATNVGGGIVIVGNGAGVVDVQSAMTTIGQTVTGTLAVTGQHNVDNLRLDGNTLSSTDANGNVIVDPNGSGLIELGAAFYPTTDSAWDIGKTGNVWNKLWLDGAIGDGTTEVTSATLQSLRDINSGVGSGMTIFWDGSKWVASLPDTEVDHGAITGLADDDHTQYALLAGRGTGQTLVGGSAASNNLVFESTSHGTKGKVLTKDTFAANTDAAYSGSWTGADLGGSSNRFRHVYTAGEFFGLRLENLGADPSPSSENVGRLFWHTGEGSVKVDTGAAIVRVSSFRYEEDTVWDGSTALKNVTVSGLDATKAIWVLKDNSDDYEQMYVSIKATSTTNVRITTNVNLPAGSYRLIGIQ
jgi:hypothetical protein